MVVGARGGGAFLFERRPTGWTEVSWLHGVESLGSPNTSWMDIHGDQVVIGAHDLGVAGDRAGGGFVFHLSTPAAGVTCESTVNSTGQLALLTLVGTVGVAANDTGFHVIDGAQRSVALLTYGAAPASLPFGNGTLCIDPLTGGLHRLEICELNAAGHGQLPVDLASVTGAGAIASGASWFIQASYRDTEAGGTGFNLTNALRLDSLP